MDRNNGELIWRQRQKAKKLREQEKQQAKKEQDEKRTK